MEDKKLINQILVGSKKADRLFYKRYQAKILGFIKKKIDNPQDAEEILQDVFTSAFLSLPTFSAKSSLYTWLCSIARHEICDFYRRRKIKTIVFSKFPFLEKLISRALSPELALQEQEIKSRILRTFKNLSEGYCRILRLKYIEERTVKEIADILGKSVKSTESLLFRARVAFQKQYSKQLNAKDKNFFNENWQIFNSSDDQGELPF